MSGPSVTTELATSEGAGGVAVEEGGPRATPLELAYAGVSRAVTTEGESEVALFGDLKRPPVRLSAVVRDPLRFREAMSALYAIVGSDYRYVPKDRAAYAASGSCRPGACTPAA